MTIVLVLFTTLAASAQTVTEISPNHAPDTGGTVVRLIGSSLLPRVVCALPCPPRVTFGDITVDAINESDEVLVVTTPPHPAGTVDVTVSIPGQDPLIILSAFTFTPTEQSMYEQVLLPVYIDGVVEGANGTRWTTDFWIRNDGPDDLIVAPGTCPPDACGGFTLQAQNARHNPGTLFSGSRSNPSQLLYLYKTPTPHVSMSLRVSDTSRQDLNAGTDLPILREADLLTEPAQLLNVPIDPATSRALLRIYDVTFTATTYAVTIYPQTEGIAQPITSGILTAKTTKSGPFRNEAAYAQFDLTGIPATGSVRVEIRPLTPGSRYWAFVSITNNQTQLVTLVRP
jgi:hypothetical protein